MSEDSKLFSGSKFLFERKFIRKLCNSLIKRFEEHYMVEPCLESTLQLLLDLNAEHSFSCIEFRQSVCTFFKPNLKELGFLCHLVGFLQY